jgi:hypothetical protein
MSDRKADATTALLTQQHRQPSVHDAVFQYITESPAKAENQRIYRRCLRDAVRDAVKQGKFAVHGPSGVIAYLGTKSIPDYMECLCVLSCIFPCIHLFTTCCCEVGGGYGKHVVMLFDPSTKSNIRHDADFHVCAGAHETRMPAELSARYNFFKELFVADRDGKFGWDQFNFMANRPNDEFKQLKLKWSQSLGNVDWFLQQAGVPRPELKAIGDTMNRNLAVSADMHADLGMLRSAIPASALTSSVPVDDTKSQTNFCSGCGAPRGGAGNFCSRCGTKL